MVGSTCLILKIINLPFFLIIFNIYSLDNQTVTGKLESHRPEVCLTVAKRSATAAAATNPVNYNHALQTVA